MSQSTLPEQLPTTSTTENQPQPVPSASPAVHQESAYELDYQPMPLMAPVALFLGISSFAALMGLFGLVLSAVGILVSLGAYLQIRASKGHLSGGKFAIAGGVMSAGFLALGTQMMIADYRAELPEGYKRVNFPREIAEKEFVVVEGRRELHPDVKPFVDQKLFLKGYIWQSQTYDDSFILLKDDGKCCFGGNPAPHDMIFIKLEKGQHFEYISGLVSVAGVLRANADAPLGQPVYMMEAQKVGKAKTVF